MALAVVRDLHETRSPATAEEIEAFETDVLSGFVLARASAGLADKTVGCDVSHLEQVRDWFGKPLWEMEPADADRYFGDFLRNGSQSLRLARAQALSTFFVFLELRFRAELHVLCGRVVASPLDDVNRPRGRNEIGIRIPPSEAEVDALFAGWRAEMATCRKYVTTARNYAAARIMADLGLRINELCKLDLADIHWDLGRFGKLHVRFGKGSRASGPRERMVPLINGSDAVLRWFIKDVWGHFDDDHTRPGAPLFPSERRNSDGSCKRISADGVRLAVANAVERHLPDWTGRLTPHALRHYCASQLYRSGMDLLAVQELLGHRWITTTMRYVHVLATHVEDAWISGQERAARRLEGLLS
ncbi:tyrosine-type recombinase/integrase [Amycolatopsis sp. CA-126428]|uniref:tyrosine-type recombinase/integrase n=1 Tax=Amycolatopsis sp. CA-126428 TaxID=2073158 RepID=UPI000CD18168|nr:tyrosine-type recombinase/integrase [Amycolatopsis sp. CA-126428]